MAVSDIDPMAALRWGVAAAGLYAGGALTFLVFKARSWRRAPAFASSQGSSLRGVAYALGRGLLPWEKESARLHLAAYLGGVGYHLGIFAGFAVLLALMLELRVPPFLWISMQFGMGLGLACGLGLLAKRIFNPNSRRLSRPDDYGSNIVVDLFLAAALVASWHAPAVPVFLGVVILLLLSMPTGKIRHCFFFFYSRVLFGAFFGRRGTLPPARQEHRA